MTRFLLSTVSLLLLLSVPSGTALGKNAEEAGTTTCHRAWVVDKRLSKGVLTAVAADTTAVWASGFTGNQAPYKGFVLRRRGGRWSSMSVAGAPMVMAADAGAAWLVGCAPGLCRPSSAVILRWDGSRWRRVPVPAVPPQTHFFADVAVRAGDAWLVSDYSSEDHTGGWVVAHQRAGRWQVSTGGNEISLPSVEAVSASAADSVWAVGSQGGSYASTGELTLHWNGSHWVNTSRLTDVYSLKDVLALSSNDVWAVGWHDPSDGEAKDAIRPFAEHWDGSRWTVMSPPGYWWRSGASVYALAAFDSGDVWAASSAWVLPGARQGGGEALLHWDGKSWRKEPMPPGATVIGELAAAPDGTLWATGGSTRGSFLAHAQSPVDGGLRCPADRSREVCLLICLPHWLGEPRPLRQTAILRELPT